MFNILPGDLPTSRDATNNIGGLGDLLDVFQNIYSMRNPPKGLPLQIANALIPLILKRTILQPQKTQRYPWDERGPGGPTISDVNPYGIDLGTLLK